MMPYQTVTLKEGNAEAMGLAYHAHGVDMVEVTEVNDAAREAYGLHIGQQMKTCYLWVARRA